MRKMKVLANAAVVCATLSMQAAQAFVVPGVALASSQATPAAVARQHVRSRQQCGEGRRESSVMSSAQSYSIDGKPITGPLVPVHDYILVRVADISEQSKGGIQLLSSSREKPNEGSVVAVGPGLPHPETGNKSDTICSPGDKLLYGKYGGTEFSYNGELHKFIRSSDVFFVFNGDRMTVDNVKMIRDQILVEVRADAETTAGGVYLAEKDPNLGMQPTRGVVVAAGPGRMSSAGEIAPMAVKVGDKIKFRDFAGEELMMDDKKYRVMVPDEIWGKFDV